MTASPWRSAAGPPAWGLATAYALVARGAQVRLIDLPGDAGERAVASLVAADVSDEDSFAAVLDVADQEAPLPGVRSGSSTRTGPRARWRTSPG